MGFFNREDDGDSQQQAQADDAAAALIENAPAAEGPHAAS